MDSCLILLIVDSRLEFSCFKPKFLWVTNDVPVGNQAITSCAADIMQQHQAAKQNCFKASGQHWTGIPLGIRDIILIIKSMIFLAMKQKGRPNAAPVGANGLTRDSLLSMPFYRMDIRPGTPGQNRQRVDTDRLDNAQSWTRHDQCHIVLKSHCC